MVPVHHPDVAVIGGGPAGAVASTLLADAGHRVLTLEREHFPRYHIGESLLSATLPIFDALGVSERLERHGFIRKPGGTFLWGRNDPWTFWFHEDPGGYPYAFHVVRSEFDAILLDNARAHGARVEEGHAVTSVSGTADGIRLEARTADGRELTVAPRLVIDASGQRGVLAGHLGTRRYDPFLRHLAVWGYYRGGARLADPLRDNIFSATFDEGWIWCIPLHDGTTSVGAVVDAAQHGRMVTRAPAAALAAFVAACPTVAETLARASLASEVHVARDYSYAATSFAGPGYLLAGDAACFVDPIFSTGVHLACLSGSLAARTAAAILAGRDETTAYADYDRAYRTTYERYLRFLYFFYDAHAVHAAGSNRPSQFWDGHRILERMGKPGESDRAFERLIIDGAEGTVPAAIVGHERERWVRALAIGRASVLPDNDLFRVRTTQRLVAA